MSVQQEDLCSQIKDIVACARTGDWSDAASGMNLFIQRLQPRLAAGDVSPDNLRKLSYSLETIILMQKQNDWVAVADVLEYELTNLIQTIPDVVPPRRSQ